MKTTISKREKMERRNILRMRPDTDLTPSTSVRTRHPVACEPHPTHHDARTRLGLLRRFVGRLEGAVGREHGSLGASRRRRAMALLGKIEKAREEIQGLREILEPDAVKKEREAAERLLRLERAEDELDGQD